eukprot:2501116-Prymnesium_polylepis.1
MLAVCMLRRARSRGPVRTLAGQYLRTRTGYPERTLMYHLPCICRSAGRAARFGRDVGICGS